MSGQYDDEGYTALHYAASHGHAAAVGALLDHGATVDARTRVGLTPLMLACHGRLVSHGDVVDVLIAHSAQLDAIDAMVGASSLMLVARNGDEGLAHRLYAAGARLDVRDHKGKSAATYALDEGHYELALSLDPLRCGGGAGAEHAGARGALASPAAELLARCCVTVVAAALGGLALAWASGCCVLRRRVACGAVLHGQGGAQGSARRHAA